MPSLSTRVPKLLLELELNYFSSQVRLLSVECWGKLPEREGIEMSSRVILLNGPPGVGKTTVGNALASLVDNGACIYGDHLKSFIVSRVEGKVAGGLGYKNGAAVATNFIVAGYELVVFEYVFEKPTHVARFLEFFRLKVPVHLFTLWAPLKVIIEREQARQNRTKLGNRVVECYQTIERNLDQLGYRIDNTDAQPIEISKLIYYLSKENVGVQLLMGESSDEKNAVF